MQPKAIRWVRGGRTVHSIEVYPRPKSGDEIVSACGLKSKPRTPLTDSEPDFIIIPSKVLHTPLERFDNFATMSGTFDNSGDGPLQVPGFNDVPLSFELPCEDRFAHGFNEWCQLPAVTACERDLVAHMNTLTDKPAWHVDVFDSTLVAKWREELITQWQEDLSSFKPLDVGDPVWKWCVAELRDKAIEFREKGYIRVLDTGSVICKSDTILNEESRADLESAIMELYDEKTTKASKPPTGQVLNIVDPALFPLVYGKTRTLRNKGTVGLTDLFASKSETKRAPGHIDLRTDLANLQHWIDNNETDHWNRYNHRFQTERKKYYWSSNFQRLPCEVKFSANKGTDVEITSYINNLHPKHHNLYRTIEKLISAAIEPWNECLIKGRKDYKTASGRQNYYDQMQRGRIPLRIVTFGPKWRNSLPKWALSLNDETMGLLQRYAEAKKLVESIPEGSGGEKKAVRARALSTIGRSHG